MILLYDFQYSGNEITAENSGKIAEFMNTASAKPSHTPSSRQMKLAGPPGSYQSTFAPPIGSLNNDIILSLPNYSCVGHMAKG